MADAATVIARLRVDGADTANRQVKQFSSGLKDTGTSARSATDSLKSMLVPLAAIGLSTGAIVGLGKAMINAASDAEEMRNKFNATFGPATQRARSELELFAEQVGRGNIELQRMAADVGAVLKSAGLMESQTADLSVNLTKLATDVASFTNANDAAVLQAFTRALTGEREALKTYGISILEAEVKTKALAMGIELVNGQLSSSDKALVTYQLLLDKTNDSQGDAELTAGSFANQLRDLQGNVADFSATLGTVMLPAATAVITKINEMADSIKGVDREFRQWLRTNPFPQNEEGLAALSEEIQKLNQKKKKLEDISFAQQLLDTVYFAGAARRNKELREINNNLDLLHDWGMDYFRSLAAGELDNEALKDWIRLTDEQIQSLKDAASGVISLGEALKNNQGIRDTELSALDRRLKAYIENNKATEAAAKAQELLQIQQIRDAQALTLLNFQIDDVISGLQDQEFFAQQVAIVMRAVESGNINAADAYKLLADFLKIVTNELDKETAAMEKRNRALAKTIALQNQVTSDALRNNRNQLGPTEPQIAGAFGGITTNALRNGYTLDPNGDLVGPAGERLNIDIFRQLVTDLFQGGSTPGDALIDAIRRIGRLFGFAQGGVVPGATGVPQLAVVHGGEEVLTPAQRGGGGRGLTVVVNVAGSVISERNLVDLVGEGLIRKIQGGAFRGVFDKA